MEFFLKEIEETLADLSSCHGTLFLGKVNAINHAHSAGKGNDPLSKVQRGVEQIRKRRKRLKPLNY